MSAETDHKTDTVPEWKRREVADLTDLLESYESLGIVAVSGIPSRQLQAMRADLHGTARLRISRNTLINRALDEVDSGLEVLTEHVEGQVGLIGSNQNPFSLFKTLEESKTPAPINAGEVAPNDILIPEGDTGMDPGPFVGDLQTVGAQAQIMDGSIKVTADSVVAEAGEVISDDLAGVLSELGIEPKEVGLDLRVAYADGVLFEADELAIDIDEYRDQVHSAVSGARSLSISASIPTTQTIAAILSTAATNARQVGIASGIESPALIADLLAHADGHRLSLSGNLPSEALPEDMAEQAVVEDSEPAPEEESTDDQSSEETEASEEPSESDDEDDDEDGGDALGAMFG